MNYCITDEQMKEIEDRAENAMFVSCKEQTKTDIDRIRFIIGDVWGSNRIILCEMVNAVSNASGSVADKETKVRIAREQLIKARMFCVEDDRNHGN